MKRIFAFLLSLLLVLTASSCALVERFMPAQEPQEPEVHTHAYGDWKVKLQPTCAKNGKRVHTCECGDEEERIVFATGLHSYQDGYCKTCGSLKPSTLTGTVITFGEYPQTLKAADVTITSVTDSRGYYRGSDGEYYAKVSSAYLWHQGEYGSSYKFTNGSDYHFSDGTLIQKGKTYYFKVEPLQWRVLADVNGTLTLLCEQVISHQRYDVGEMNNYSESDIRTWLNETFLAAAFSETEQAKISVTNVDNSASTTVSDNNNYACDQTQDKVFLASYKDLVNTDYGFESDPSRNDVMRQKQVSDYARATGAFLDNNPAYNGNGNWWLRSPSAREALYAYTVNSHGNVNVASNVTYKYIGVAPAITLSADDLS